MLVPRGSFLHLTSIFFLAIGHKTGEWKIRWFVLQGVTFASYTQRGKEEPQKVLNLVGAEVKKFKEPRRPFGISITLKNGTLYELAAESEMDREDWLERLKDIAEKGTKSKFLGGGSRLEKGAAASGGISSSTSSVPRLKPDRADRAKHASDSGVPHGSGGEEAKARKASDQGPSRPASDVGDAKQRKSSEPMSQKSAKTPEAAKPKSDPSSRKANDNVPAGASMRKQMFAGEGPKLSAQPSSPSGGGGAAKPTDDKIGELYEKYKNKLLKGGIEREEFSRNSEVIMKVLDFEEKHEASTKRYERSYVADEDDGDSGALDDQIDSLMSDSSESASSSAASLPAPVSSAKPRLTSSAPAIDNSSVVAEHGAVAALKVPKGHRSQNFIERRDSMKFEKKHLTLREMCSTDDPNLRYKKMVKIGEGSFGTVFVAVDKESKQRVAIKKMAITKKNRQHLEMEMEVHKLCSGHPNVVPILEAFLVQNAKIYEVWVVLQFLEYGALTETLTQLNMKEPEIAFVCKELVNALSFLHSKNTIHRDLKSDNILLGSNGEVKLADFGLAIQLHKGQEKRRSVLGTPYWMSPEIINGRDYDDRVDVWALGITTIEMMEKHPPYISYPKTKALFLITSQGVPLTHFAAMEQWSAVMKDWLAKCLTYDSHKRPNIWQLVDHPFLRNACSTDEFVKRCIVPMKGKIKPCVVM